MVKKEVLKLSKGFRELPERVQDVWWQFCNMSITKESYQNLAFLNMSDFLESINTYCKSPIEKIFYMAYCLMDFDINEGKYRYLTLYPQKEVNVGNKKYYLDFCFIAEDCGYESDYKLAIECDGHDFHEKTKEQVIRDNERTLDLKMAGYDLLRFSGSQIYNEPFKCAAKTMKYILKKVKE